jgi:plasmid stability protein
MTNPLPLTIETDETLGVAIRLRAAKEGVSTEEVVSSILRKALAPEIEEATGTVPLAAVIQKVVQAGNRAG